MKLHALVGVNIPWLMEEDDLSRSSNILVDNKCCRGGERSEVRSRLEFEVEKGSLKVWHSG